MHLTLSLRISALYLFILLAHAIPIRLSEPPRGLAHQKRSSYSIVDIDGSSPPPLSAATTSIFRTVTRTIDDTKTLTVLSSTVVSSKEVITLAKTITELAPPMPVIPISTVTSISTLRITTTELETSISTVTQRVSETVRPSASYVTLNPAEETPPHPEEVPFRQFPTLSVASYAETVTATPSQQSPSLRPSITSDQAIIPTSTTDSSQPGISSAGFNPPPWSNSYPYLNNSSSAVVTPREAAASTGTTAYFPKIRKP